MIPIGLETFFSREIIKFWKCLVVLELYAIMYVKIEKKIVYAKNAKTSELKKELSLKIQQDKFKASTYIM